MISPEKFSQIEEALRLLEKEENITVLWACESGSRAWGFESQDSDYDVRFITSQMEKFTEATKETQFTKARETTG